MKKYSQQDQKILATWAADCAEQVLPFFETAYPKDKRPREAIKACRTWVQTGIFKMVDIRGASLASHAAAREAKENKAACFAARAAGQAVATTHVTQHAYGSAYYALKAIVSDDPINAEIKVTKARNLQSLHLSKNLREEIMDRIIISYNKKRVVVKIKKGDGF